MVESQCTRDMTNFKDVLKERKGASDFMYVSREIRTHSANNRHKPPVNPIKLQNDVLASPPIQKLIEEISKENNITKQKASYLIKDILQEIGYSRDLPIVRWLGYFLLKILKKTVKSVYVNEEKLLQIRNQMGKNPVIFVPSHRSYADFILMAMVSFHFDIMVPCVAAGMDFHSMWLMGKVLRDCSAFFMRRSFSDDKIYRTTFTEYVKSLIIEGDAPVEFFIEGTRSRSSKTLPPKFGLLSMVMDTFYGGKVPDITIIPINITYDRTLEEVLFAYEMLGIAKPKESTSGLIKGLKMMDERYGNVYMDFGDPISVKSFVSQLVGGPVDFTMRNPAREQEQILQLGYSIVDTQQKFSVLTCFNVFALVLSNHISVSTTPLTLGQAIKDVSWLATVLGVLGALVDVKKDTLVSLMEAIDVHKSLVRLTPQDEIQLVSVHTPQNKVDPRRLKGHLLRGETMYLAVPLLMLQQYVNPCMHFIVGPAIITVIMQHLGDTGHITRDELYSKYQFLRSVLTQEFAFFKVWESKDFNIALEKLELVNIVESSEGGLLTLGNHKKLQLMLCNLLYPFLSSYLSFGKLLLETDSVVHNERTLLKLAQAKVEEELCKGQMLSYCSLSLDIMSAALSSFTFMQGITRIRANGEVKYQVNTRNLYGIIQQLEQLEVQPQMQTDPNELSSKHVMVQGTTTRAKL